MLLLLMQIRRTLGDANASPAVRAARVRVDLRLRPCLRVRTGMQRPRRLLCVQIQPQNIVTYGVVHAARTVGVFE